MEEGYAPTSNFLVWVLNDEAPLSGSEQAEHNLRKVIALTADADTSNRDWAVFILGNSNVANPEVIAALKSRAEDVDARVKAQAIWGLACKAPHEALPFVRKALQAPFVTVPIFEAAALLRTRRSSTGSAILLRTERAIGRMTSLRPRFTRVRPVFRRVVKVSVGSEVGAESLSPAGRG